MKVWSDESVLSLQDCFNCTDWEMFKQSTGDLDELTDVICSYATFCRDTIVSSKRVKIYPNNRPWVTKSVKSCVKKKKCAFKKGVAPDLLLATKELKTEILRAKQKYRSELENKMAANTAWSSMKVIACLCDTR